MSVITGKVCKYDTIVTKIRFLGYEGISFTQNCMFKLFNFSVADTGRVEV